MRRTGLVAAGLAWLLGASAATAQVPSPTGVPADPPHLVIEGARFVATRPPAGAADPAIRAVSEGPVTVRLEPGGRLLLEAGRAVVWTRPAGAGAPPATGTLGALQALGTQVYAEGGVVFRPGPGRVLRAESLFLDPGAGRAVLRGVRLRLPAPGGGDAALVVVAERARLQLAATGDDVLTLAGATLATCDHAVPHFGLGAATLELRGVIAETGGAAPVPPLWLSASGLTLDVLGCPVLWAPGIAWNLDWDSPVRHFEAGRSRAYGPFARTLLGITLREAEADGTRRRIGEAGIRLEGYGLRGAGGGGEVRFAHPAAEARDAFGDRARVLDVDALAIGWRDAGDPREADAPPGLWPAEQRDRWRVHPRVVAFPWPWLRVTAEWHALSDRNLLREFADRVRKEAKAPESFVAARVATGPVALEVSARTPWNDFQTGTEYLPRARGLLAGLIVAPMLQLSVAAEAGHVRRIFDEATGLSHVAADRGDATATLEALPVARPVSLLGAVWGRATAWSEGPTEPDGLQRTASGFALRATTDIHRVFGEGLGRFRHVISPTIGWEGTFDVSRPPADLFAFDAVETLRARERVYARCRSALQVPDGAGSRDWLFAELEAEWFPRPRRDHGDERVGDVRGEVRFAPRPGPDWWARATWRPPDGRVVAWEAGAMWTGFLPGCSAGLSTTNADPDVHAATLMADVRLTARWSAGFRARYDFEQGRAQETRVAVRRLFHCVVLEAGVVVDHRDDDLTLVMSLSPVGFGADPLALGGRAAGLGVESR